MATLAPQDTDTVVEEMAVQIRRIADQRIQLPSGKLEAAMLTSATFCDGWKTAEPVLQALCNAVGGLAKIICPVLIAAGNRACKLDGGGGNRP